MKRRKNKRNQRSLLSKGEQLIVKLDHLKTKQSMSLCMWYRRRGDLTPDQWGLVKGLLKEEVL